MGERERGREGENPEAFVRGVNLNICPKKRKFAEKTGKFTGKSDIISRLVSRFLPCKNQSLLADFLERAWPKESAPACPRLLTLHVPASPAYAPWSPYSHVPPLHQMRPLPPLRTLIISHVVAAWPVFHDLRAAASANVHKDGLLNSVSIMFTELLVVLSAAHLLRAPLYRRWERGPSARGG